jgi:hypothetical protein
MKIWPPIYLALVPLSAVGGYREMQPEATAGTNADWIFVSITFVTCSVFPIGAAAYGFRHSGKSHLRRPTWDRPPLGWWTDTLQPIRVSLAYAALAVFGAALALPHADEKGRMMFWFLAAMAFGLFIGERFVYAIYRKRIGHESNIEHAHSTGISKPIIAFWLLLGIAVVVLLIWSPGK